MGKRFAYPLPLSSPSCRTMLLPRWSMSHWERQVNGIIDLAGPERFRFDAIIRQFLSATQDTRQVVVDTHARYFGAKLDEQSLVPIGNSRIGATRIGWLSQFKGNGGVGRGGYPE